MARVTIAPSGVGDTASSERPPTLGIVGRATAAAVGVAVIVGAVVAVLTVWWAGLIVTAVVGAGAWFGVIAPRVRSADQRAVALLGPARAPDRRAEARLVNLVEGLAPAAGLPRPTVLVIDDDAPNALALGRERGHGTVVVTTGLLARLDRMQLEAVVAHLLLELRDGLTGPATLSLAFQPSRSPAAVAHAAADADAVALTRYPPALASALEAIANGGPAAPRRASPTLQPLWLVPPGDTAGAAARVEALRGL